MTYMYAYGMIDVRLSYKKKKSFVIGGFKNVALWRIYNF